MNGSCGFSIFEEESVRCVYLIVTWSKIGKNVSAPHKNPTNDLWIIMNDLPHKAIKDPLELSQRKERLFSTNKKLHPFLKQQRV